MKHLYVHIPFCPKLCPYCSFYSELSDRNKTQGFLDALLRELEIQSAGATLQPETIFFGGGTPSALSTPQLGYLLTGLRNRLDLSRLQEWTLEMNPATVSLEKAALLKELGVNRISMGVQSWDEEVLRTLGRVHDARQAQRSYQILRKAGFENINLDLMFAIPGQTEAQWQQTLEKTISLDPEHISAYCLTYEEDTEYFSRFTSGEFRQDVERDARLFEFCMNRLEGAGYAQYEISNYAKPGRECLHNFGYWSGGDYLGIGPSAFSTRGGRRWQNIPSAEHYTSRTLAGESAVSFQENLDEQTRLGESIAFSLRTNRGVDRSLLKSWSREVETFRQDGFFQDAGENRLILSRKGKLVADALAETFV